MSLKNIGNHFQDREQTLEIGYERYTFKWDSQNEVYEVTKHRRNYPHDSFTLNTITYMSKDVCNRFRTELSKL